MSLKALGLSIIFIWSAIYALYGCFLRYGTSLLPTTSSAGRCDSLVTPPVQIGLKILHFRAQTTFWNRAHDRLASGLADKHSSKWRSILTRFYDVGCVLGLVGMLVALSLLLWTTGNLFVSLLVASRQTWEHHEMIDGVGRSMKRTLEDTQVFHSGSSGRAFATIKPIVSHNLTFSFTLSYPPFWNAFWNATMTTSATLNVFSNLDPWRHGAPQSSPHRDLIRIHKSSYSWSRSCSIRGIVRVHVPTIVLGC